VKWEGVTLNPLEPTHWLDKESLQHFGGCVTHFPYKEWRKNEGISFTRDSMIKAAGIPFDKPPLMDTRNQRPTRELTPNGVSHSEQKTHHITERFQYLQNDKRVKIYFDKLDVSQAVAEMQKVRWKTFSTKRNHSFFVPPTSTAVYKFGGKILRGQAFTRGLTGIQKQLKDMTGRYLESATGTKYTKLTDREKQRADGFNLKPHKDSESLHDNVNIVSVSAGANAKMLLWLNPKDAPLIIELSNGMVVEFDGRIKHAIKDIEGERYNWTFRNVKQSSHQSQATKPSTVGQDSIPTRHIHIDQKLQNAAVNPNSSPPVDDSETRDADRRQNLLTTILTDLHEHLPLLSDLILNLNGHDFAGESYNNLLRVAGTNTDRNKGWLKSKTVDEILATARRLAASDNSSIGDDWILPANTFEGTDYLNRAIAAFPQSEETPKLLVPFYMDSHFYFVECTAPSFEILLLNSLSDAGHHAQIIKQVTGLLHELAELPLEAGLKSNTKTAKAHNWAKNAVRTGITSARKSPESLGQQKDNNSCGVISATWTLFSMAGAPLPTVAEIAQGDIMRRLLLELLTADEPRTEFLWGILAQQPGMARRAGRRFSSSPLVNFGRSCFLNTALQWLFYSPRMLELTEHVRLRIDGAKAAASVSNRDDAKAIIDSLTKLGLVSSALHSMATSTAPYKPIALWTEIVKLWPQSSIEKTPDPTQNGGDGVNMIKRLQQWVEDGITAMMSVTSTTTIMKQGLATLNDKWELSILHICECGERAHQSTVQLRQLIALHPESKPLLQPTIASLSDAYETKSPMTANCDKCNRKNTKQTCLEQIEAWPMETAIFTASGATGGLNINPEPTIVRPGGKTFRLHAVLTWNGTHCTFFLRDNKVTKSGWEFFNDNDVVTTQNSPKPHLIQAVMYVSSDPPPNFPTRQAATTDLYADLWDLLASASDEPGADVPTTQLPVLSGTLSDRCKQAITEILRRSPSIESKTALQTRATSECQLCNNSPKIFNSLYYARAESIWPSSSHRSATGIRTTSDKLCTNCSPGNPKTLTTRTIYAPAKVLAIATTNPSRTSKMMGTTFDWKVGSGTNKRTLTYQTVGGIRESKQSGRHTTFLRKQGLYVSDEDANTIKCATIKADQCAGVTMVICKLILGEADCYTWNQKPDPSTQVKEESAPTKSPSTEHCSLEKKQHLPAPLTTLYVAGYPPTFNSKRIKLLLGILGKTKITHANRDKNYCFIHVDRSTADRLLSTPLTHMNKSIQIAHPQKKRDNVEDGRLPRSDTIITPTPELRTAPNKTIWVQMSGLPSYISEDEIDKMLHHYECPHFAIKLLDGCHIGFVRLRTTEFNAITAKRIYIHNREISFSCVHEQLQAADEEAAVVQPSARPAKAIQPTPHLTSTDSQQTRPSREKRRWLYVGGLHGGTDSDALARAFRDEGYSIFKHRVFLHQPYGFVLTTLEQATYLTQSARLKHRHWRIALAKDQKGEDTGECNNTDSHHQHAQPSRWRTNALTQPISHKANVISRKPSQRLTTLKWRKKKQRSAHTQAGNRTQPPPDRNQTRHDNKSNRHHQPRYQSRAQPHNMDAGSPQVNHQHIHSERRHLFARQNTLPRDKPRRKTDCDNQPQQQLQYRNSSTSRNEDLGGGDAGQTSTHQRAHTNLEIRTSPQLRNGFGYSNDLHQGTVFFPQVPQEVRNATHLNSQQVFA
jgi:hypothetical protein